MCVWIHPFTPYFSHNATLDNQQIQIQRFTGRWIEGGVLNSGLLPGRHGVETMLSRDGLWSLLFSVAIAILMIAILLIRDDPVPTWVLLVYPLVGALLANIASRTSPTIEEIAWIETGTIAAAAIVILAGLINLLLIELLLREVISGEFLSGDSFRRFSFFALPAISALLWWALERRLTRMRRAGRRAAELPFVDADTDKNKQPSDPVVYGRAQR